MTRYKQPFKILPSFYKTVLKEDADIYLLWGGRDRGASHFTAQRALLDLLNDKQYYRAILIRKTYESIRDSQYQTIKDIAEANGLDQYLTFLRSPLEIRCNTNNNKIIARGCDNPAKLKSTRDPNVAIIEEADQLTEQDYITIHTTLRHESAKIRQWMAFNSDFPGDYEDHWLWRYYLQHIPNTYESGLYTTEIDVPYGDDFVSQQIKFYSHHSTYRNNPYCPPSRRAVYEGLKEQNEYYYNVYAKGILGKKENDNPWAWALSEDKHYNPSPYTIDNNYPLILSWDFNHDPCTVVVSQFQSHIPRYNVIAYYRASSGDESAIKQLCDKIKREYPHHTRTRQMVITGDATGVQRSPDRPATVNRYTEIASQFNSNVHALVKIERANTSHKASRDLCNDVLHLIPKGGYVFWGGRGCEMLIAEIQSAYPDDKESLNKAKKELGLHGLDAWRYLNQYLFAHRLKGANFKEYQKKIMSAVARLSTPVKS